MRRTRWVTALGALAMLGGGVLVGVLAAPGPRRVVASGPAVTTAPVVERSLSATVSVPGTLTYRAGPGGTPYSVVDAAQGIYTQLPTAGEVVSQGQVLYQVDGVPAVLLYGSTPAYRSLSAGLSGPDVVEMDQDLASLGYASAAQLAPGDTFGAATTAAVQRLQASLGQPQTGVLALGQVVFEPSALRVTTEPVVLGGTAQPGQVVLQATSTARQVEVQLDSSQQNDVAAGDEVTISLPDGRTTAGVVASVGTVAACPASTGGGQTTSASPAPGDTCPSTGSGSVSGPTVDVAVTPSDPASTGTWDQAPVQVGITTARVASALVVPVTALLSEPGGGYAVEVAGRGGSDRLQPVSLGLFDDGDGLVQVTGASLAAGDEVVVPTR